MKSLIGTLPLVFLLAPAWAQSSSEESTSSFWSGNLYARAAYSYQTADDYHSGYDSFATRVFDENDGEYTFHNYSIDLVYITRSGFYFGTGLYSSYAEVSTDGLGLGVPDTDSNFEPREIPLAIGYETKIDDTSLRVEGRFVINIDDDFDRSFASAADDAVLLPVTDGSDSFVMSVRGKKQIWDFDHTLLLGYQIYENGVEHPIFPSFSLGDRFFIDYELSKVFGDLKIGVGHLYSQSQQTDGKVSAITGTEYLIEKSRYSELRLDATYRITPRLLCDAGFKYYYDGKDAPKQETLYLGIAYIF